MYIKSFIDKLSDFVEQVYKVDTAVIAPTIIRKWLKARQRRGELPFERAGIPDRRQNGSLVPGGYITTPIHLGHQSDHLPARRVLIKGIQESAKHARYKDWAAGAVGRHYDPGLRRLVG